MAAGDAASTLKVYLTNFGIDPGQSHYRVPPLATRRQIPTSCPCSSGRTSLAPVWRVWDLPLAHCRVLWQLGAWYQLGFAILCPSVSLLGAFLRFAFLVLFSTAKLH